MLNQPTAKHGPDRGGDRRRARPRADRLSTTLFVEGRTDNRETSGHQECSSYSLNAPGDDQLMNGRSKTTTGGCNRENGHADQVDPTAPKQVTQGAPDENQRAQKQTIRLDHPLHIHHGRVKATLYRRQSDVDNCVVDECQAGTKNRCSENPCSGPFATRDFATA